MFISKFIINLMLMVMPLPTIWRMHMLWTKKLAVTGILLMAFMAVIASVIRLVIVLEVSTTSYTAVWDEDETIATIFYWGMIEAGLALIACSLPSLKPLVTAQGLQSALNSVRSVASLRSYSNFTSTSKDFEQPKADGKSFTTSTGDVEIGTLLRDDQIMEIKITAIRSGEPASFHPEGSIRIQREVSIQEQGL